MTNARVAIAVDKDLDPRTGGGLVVWADLLRTGLERIGHDVLVVATGGENSVRLEGGDMSQKARHLSTRLGEWGAHILLSASSDCARLAASSLPEKCRYVLNIQSAKPSHVRREILYESHLDGVVGCSMAVTSEILRQATDRSRVYCVPNGIPAAKAESVPLLDRQMKVAVVGRLEVEQKRCHWIPRVFEATLAHCPQASWDLIGDGGLEPWLKDFAAGASGLEVVGQMERGALGSYLRSVPRVLLMTSAYEGLSFVMLEALQSGCALVISSDPRATGLAIDSRHAVLVEMGASGVLRSSVARGIGEAIALALSGNQAIVARSRVGREIVQDELTAERMSLGFSQVLNSIADRPRRRRSGSHGIPRYSRRPGEALLSRITWGFERVRLRR